MADTPTPAELTEQMFAAVGSAITQWTFVEADLAALFSLCVGGAVPHSSGGLQHLNYQVSSAVFFAVESFSARRALVDSAFAAYIHGETPNEGALKAEWAKLSDKARKLSHSRNKLAHWFVRPAQRTGSGEDHEPIAPARLMPSYNSPKYIRETAYRPTKLSQTVVQVSQMEKAFCLLAAKIRDFTRRVGHEPELSDRYARQALHRLGLDGRLDRPLLGAIERALASRE
jgi:hypothetical protein